MKTIFLSKFFSKNTLANKRQKKILKTSKLLNLEINK
jgi:hypothetical protein